jgi:hypothetical protein
MEILAVLRSLDTTDDSRWTGDGLPRVEFVSEIMGRNVTRREITETAPLFTRLSPVIPGEEPDPETESDPTLSRDPDDDRPDITLAGPPPPPEESTPEGPEPEHVVNQRNLRAWLAQQHQNRIDRAARRKATLEALPPGTDLSGRSPLDEAMARRTRRGMNRPDFLGLGPQSRG